MPLRRFLLTLVLVCAATCTAPGIILYETGDPAANAATPGDNSGWQYEGYFAGYACTPVAPYFFLAAKHIGGYVGQVFLFHGEQFTTTAYYDDASATAYTDLRLWKVDHPFATYAPLFLKNGDEVGRELHLFGRGTQRGAGITLNGTLRGWANGTADGVQRWGRNTVADLVAYTDDTASPYHVWTFLQATFDAAGPVHEAHVSDGDSSGGNFILEDGLWRLAGITYGRDELFTDAQGDGGFSAAVFNADGYYEQQDDGTYQPVVADPAGSNVPTSFYSTLVSARLDWIKSIVGDAQYSAAPVDVTVLPPESFGSWEHGYFTPADLANNAVSGPRADPDGDGVPNLLEFAFNLDPTFAEPAVMTAGTGLRGLPLIRVEQVNGDRRLTVEYVRRTAGSGAGLSYAVQFADRPGADANWQPGGTENVMTINTRWERVKVVDSISVGGATPVRFARVAVTQSSP